MRSEKRSVYEYYKCLAKSLCVITIWGEKMMPECRICGKSMRWIQNTHLRLHNITREEYIHKFPDAILKDEEITQTFKY